MDDREAFGRVVRDALDLSDPDVDVAWRGVVHGFRRARRRRRARRIGGTTLAMGLVIGSGVLVVQHRDRSSLRVASVGRPAPECASSPTSDPVVRQRLIDRKLKQAEGLQAQINVVNVKLAREPDRDRLQALEAERGRLEARVDQAIEDVDALNRLSSSGQPRLTLRDVDATRYPTISATALLMGTQLGQLQLCEEGEPLDDVRVVPFTRTGRRLGVVFAIDVASMNRRTEWLSDVRGYAERFVEDGPATTEVAIVALGDRARVVRGFTADANKVGEAIAGLTVGGGSAIWDGVNLGLDLFERRPDLQPNIIVVSNGRDTASGATVEATTARARSSGAVVLAVADGRRSDARSLEGLADATGGQLSAWPVLGAVTFSHLRLTLKNQYELSYTSTARGQVTLDLRHTADGIGSLHDSRRVALPMASTSRQRDEPGSRLHWVIASAGVVAMGLVFLAVRRRRP